MTPTALRAAAVLLLLVLPLSIAADTEGDGHDTVRLLTIVPRVFGYSFMSYMGDGPDGYRLVFNTPDGETAIVRPGERLGDYTVGAFTQVVERVFNPTVQAELERKSGTVELLAAADGERLELTLGQPLTVPGWTACLVDTDSGDWRYVNAGDRLVQPNGSMLRVRDVTEEQAVLHDGERERIPPRLTDAEHAALTALWAARAERRREAIAAAARAAEPDLLQTAPIFAPAPAPPQPPRRTVTVRNSPPGFMFGTDYPFPTAFQVLRVPVRTANGQIVHRYISVPTRFERRMYGMGFGPGAR